MRRTIEYRAASRGIGMVDWRRLRLEWASR